MGTDVSGVELFLQCYGEKGHGPTVLLLHGIGDRASSASWDKVVSRLGPSTFVCRYDRAGTGKSAPANQHDRTGQDLVANLRGLVTAAKLPEPYLLVGHSFGGYPLRLFVDTFPQAVDGAIFVDAIHERIGLLEATGAESWDEVPQAQERLDLAQVEQAVRQSTFPNDLPVHVLTRGEGVSEAWSNAQNALLGLSTDSQHCIVEGSGHEIPRENPDAVVSAINSHVNN